MVSTEQRDELVAFDGGDDWILSVYLDLTANRQVQRMYQAAFRDMARRCEGELTGHDRQKALRVEVERVNAFLEDEPHRGQGLAIFTCADRDYWRVFFTPTPLADDVFYAAKPTLRPLLEVMDEYERYAMALVDSKEARLFSVYLGGIEDTDSVMDDVQGRHHQGGWSQQRFQRHISEEIDGHLRNAAEALLDLYQRQPFDRLVLAGPEEPLARFRELLPGQMQERVSATGHIEMAATDDAVLQQSLELHRGIERQHELELVEQLNEFAGAGGRGTQGLNATLDALWNGQVDTLLVADDARQPGAECPACGRLVASGRPLCPACGERMEQLGDVVERAMLRALGQSGKVEIVRDDAAARLREQAGGVGAILRYVINPADAVTPAFQSGSGPGNYEEAQP